MDLKSSTRQRPADPSTYLFEKSDKPHLRSSLDFMKEVCTYAQENSDDAITKNGVIIRTVDGRLVYGANMVPGTVKITDERVTRPLKYQYIEHGERTAIYRAAMEGVATEGATLYQIWFPCVDCARAIICSGIKEIVGIKKIRDLTPEHWQESLKTSEGMLNEAGVKITFVEEPIGVKMPFNNDIVDL